MSVDSVNDRIHGIMTAVGLRRGSGRQLAVGASTNFLFKIIWKGLGFASAVLLARLLGVEGLGTYTFAFTIVAFITTAGTASMKWLLVQRLSGFLSLEEWSLARGLQRRAREIGLVSAVVLAACAGIAVWLFVSPDAHGLRTTLMIAVILAPIASQIHLNSAVLQALGHVTLCQLPEWIFRPLAFLIILTIFHLVPQVEMSAPTAMVAQILSAAGAMLFASWLVSERLPSNLKAARPTYRTNEWLRAGVPFLTVGILEKVNTQASILILGTLLGAEAVGIFRPAAVIALLLMFGGDAVAIAVRPYLARRYAQGQTDGFQRLSAYATLASFGVAFVGAVIALAFGDIILLAFGPAFVEGTTILGTLCVGRAVFAAMGLPGVFLAMTGRQSMVMHGTMWAAGTNVVLNLVLIPQFGVNGAAVAMVVSMLVLHVHNMLAVRRELSIDTSVLGLRFLATQGPR